MILSALSQSDRYAALHPQFALVFDYIRNTDLYALPPAPSNVVRRFMSVALSVFRPAARRFARVPEPVVVRRESAASEDAPSRPW